ncbi:conserved membrane hypothetical protein [[Clostridium] ultunense Esp]|nr:conserved membrane hypothetical protein [[Clostridium] ultunense Esp]
MREIRILIWNEMEKIYRKRRFLVIFLILLLLIPLFVYAQYKQNETVLERMGTKDWHLILQQQIIDNQNRLNSSRLPDEWRSWLVIRNEQLQYYLDHDINPNVQGGPAFVRSFMENGITLFIPLLVMIVSIDLVSGERSEGTMKLLLTRPIRRWKVLLSKYIAMLLSLSLVVLMVAVLSYFISGFIFGYSGWNTPLLTGFIVEKESLNTTSVHLISQWKYILMAYGLGWFVSWAVATISFMVSVLLRNTAAAMGIMIASLIAGNLLTNYAASWKEARYIFSVNLDLTSYLSGLMPPIEGMTPAFSMITLTVWAVVSLFISFAVFTRQDMFH